MRTSLLDGSKRPTDMFQMGTRQGVGLMQAMAKVVFGVAASLVLLAPPAQAQKTKILQETIKFAGRTTEAGKVLEQYAARLGLLESQAASKGLSSTELLGKNNFGSTLGDTSLSRKWLTDSSLLKYESSFRNELKPAATCGVPGVAMGWGKDPATGLITFGTCRGLWELRATGY